MRRLWEIEEENSRLKRLVTDPAPDKQVLQEALQNHW